ncbi:MAG: VanW family protein, partial [Clostridiales bacterium]
EKVLNIEKKYNNKFKIEISMNKVKLNDLIDEIYKKTYVEKADKSLKIVGDEFFYYTGREGNEIDKSELYSLISKKIKDFDDSELNIAIKIDEPKEVPVDEIEKLINVPVKEVTYRLIDNEIKIIESSMGFRYTKSEIKEFLKSTESVKDEKIRIPVNEIIPEYTSEEAEKLLFNSTLASENMKFIYTIFPYDRFNNVKKSISQLDEYVVLPGEVFSFNKVIGECTIEKGYLDGGTLYNGENSSGVGAGICQTVSLLNMAVTNTGLEIIEKTNSQENAKYIDDEVNLDISYPNIDYKFKNTTLFPIKILGKVSDKGEINISIIGTKSDL